MVIPITEPNLEDVYELSPMQQGILFHTLYDPDGDPYFEQCVVTFRGKLDQEHFARAWQRVAARHSILRTSFHWEGLEKPVQVVHSEVEVPFQFFDWSDLPEPVQRSRFDAFIQGDRRKSFELASAPLFRVAVVRRGEDLYDCLLSFQHLLLDRWSRLLVIKEVFREYAAGAGDARPPATRPYGDYIAWLQARDREQAEAFWRRELAGFKTPTSFAPSGRREPPSARTFEDARRRLSEQDTEDLQSFARSNRLTLNTLVAGAWAILASRYSGEEDVLFGATVAGRPSSVTNVESMVGLFINTLPVRVRVPAREHLLPWLRKLQTQFLELREYEHSSLIDIQGWSEVPRGTPLFESLMVFENVGGDFDSVSGDGPLTVLRGRASGGVTHYPLTLIAVPGRELSLHLLGDGELFEKNALSRMLGHFVTLVRSMVARGDGDEELSTLPLLTEDERRELLLRGEQTRRDSPIRSVHEQFETVHALFEAQARRTPDAVAVQFDREQLTYAELNRRANQLARFLRRRGVGPDVMVGVCLDPSLELVLGILAILKAGGAYVPLDPVYPADRLAFLIEDSGVRTVLTQRHLGSRCPSTASLVFLDTDWPAIGQESGEDVASGATPENLLYVIYTSGTTGRPKGVLVTHDNVVRLLQATEPWFGFGERDVWTLFHSSAFDFSVWELWGALAYGGRLVVVPYLVSRSPNEFYELLSREKVTVLNQTPSAFRQLIQAEEESAVARPLDLRVVIFGGEALEISSLRPWFARHGDRSPRLVNMYGITETTVHVTYRPLTAADLSAPGSRIGRPIPGLRVYLLDSHLEPVPVGVPGEMYVGGSGVARGYLHRPKLTEERFLSDPFRSDGARMYRTGDRARLLPDGDIQFLGRLDDQVKIRGYRIEIGEIEEALARHPDVAACAVAAQKEESGDRRLVGYLVPRDGASPSVFELRDFLKKALPDYMVPSAFVRIAAIPLTPHGKIDRSALPAPDPEAALRAAESLAPRNPVEEILAGIWSELLQVERVGVEDDFFSLGGHSLLATQVISRIRYTFGVELPLSSLFETPTVAGLARAVGSRRQTASATALPLVRDPRSTNLPLSFAQQRLWFLEQLEPGKAFYTISRALRLSGDLDTAALEDAFRSLLQRHESLRTGFTSVEGRPVQNVQPDRGFEIATMDLTALPEPERETEAARRIDEQIRRPFDLERGPLLRVSLIRLREGDHVLVLTMHHIVSDGWSMGILVKELAAYYEELSGGRRAQLAELPIQYGDFARWQRKWLTGEVLEEQLSYWKQQLTSLPVLELPTDRPRPPVQGFRGSRESITFSNDLVAGLKELSRREGATLYMTLLAGFGALLGRYTGQQDVVVGSFIAGRNRSEIEGLIGFFVNTLVMRMNLSEDPTFRELLRHVREVALGAWAHQDLPFEKLVEELHPARSLARNPLVQTTLTLQNAPVTQLDLPGVVSTPVDVETTATHFDLEVYLTEQPNGLTCALVYATDLFDPSTIVRMLGHYERLLEDVVSDAGRRTSELSLLSEAELRQVLLEWNRTDAEYPREKTVHRLFEEQVERTPDAVAVEFEGSQLTYGELNRRSNELALHLCRLGVGPEILVGICLERSLEMLIAIFGVLKAGGAYLPLDPSYPDERLSFMLQDAMPAVVVTESGLANRLPTGTAQRRVFLDEPWPTAARLDTERIATTALSGNTAYVLYTSGSSGKPKGVSVSHLAVVNLLTSMADRLGLGSEDRLFAVTTLSFDIAALEMYLPLAVGARIVLASREVASSGARLLEAVNESDATVMQATPATWQMMIEAGWQGKSPFKILCGGEALSRDLANQLMARGTSVSNLYGPTETTIWSTLYTVCHEEGPVPIGRPIANTQIYLLDAARQPVPIGVDGEIYIGGAGVASGYLNRPDLTAEKFVADPFCGQPGARLYRTGDVGRYRPDRNIEYVGRVDEQIKLRGYRIEPGEIEAALARHPDVAGCAVAALQEGLGDKRLVGYVVPREGSDPPVNELRDFLKKALPDYMVPSAFVRLPTIPLTPNGKIDRSALPSPDTEAALRAAGSPAPRNPVEEVLAGIWCHVLGLERVGIHDNFFELGGHSLLATRILARLHAAFPVRLPLRTLFEKPTIAELSAAIEEFRGSDSGPRRSAIVPISRRAISGEAASVAPAGENPPKRSRPE